jgi:hypothetical protein
MNKHGDLDVNERRAAERAAMGLPEPVIVRHYPADTVTADDIYALGMAVGNILRDVDPAKRDRVLDLIRALERKAS